MCTVCDSVDQFEAGGFCSALLGVDCISCKGMFNEYLTRTTAVCAYDVVQFHSFTLEGDGHHSS